MKFETDNELRTSGLGITNNFEIRSASKSYGLTRAVRNVTTYFNSSEITAVVGGNGAGKSTLMKMIAGEVTKDSGELLLNGVPSDAGLHSPSKAHSAGIRIVHQELSLFGSLTVAENFYIEQGSAGSSGRKWRANAWRTATVALNETFGSDHGISPGSKIDQLNAGQRQMVEITRAASSPGLRILILDEPTSALGLEFIAPLASFVRGLQQQGVVVIFITHKMSELPRFTDRVVVMREGQLVADMPTSDSTTDGLLSIMLGGPENSQTGDHLDVLTDAPPTQLEKKILVSVTQKHFAETGGIRVGTGEVVGLVGLQDAGQESVLRSIQTNSRRGIVKTVSSAYITGDRKNEGIFPLWDSQSNLVVSALANRGSFRIFSARAIRGIVEPWFKRLNLSRTAGHKPISQLSGGMQQKVLFARGLATDADLLLLNDPTRGVDLATKNDMYRMVRSAADNGKGVLWYSSEDSESKYFDRAYVMHNNAVVAEFSGDEISSEKIMKAAFASQDQLRETKPAAAPSAKVLSVAQMILRQPWIFAFVGLAVILGILDARLQILTDAFGLGLILTLAPVLAIAALSQMFIVSVGDIDLSVGAFMGLIGVISATTLTTQPLVGVGLVVASILLYSALAWFLQVRQFPALVATLAMSFVYTGLALTILPNVGGIVPSWLSSLSHIGTPLLPFSVWLLLVLGLVGWFVIERTALGTRIRALGSNPSALELSGWNITIVRVAAYTLAGLTAAVAGLLFAGIATSGDAGATDGYTLMTIAAVVIGGCEFLGGRVSPIGVVLAATLLSLVGVLLGVLAVPPLFTAAATGVLLLFVMGLRRLVRDTRRA